MNKAYMKQSNKILIALVSIVSVSLAISAAVFAASGGVGGRPANPDPDNPRTQSIFIFTLKPGESKSDQLYLSNGGDTDETVDLYAVDGTVSNTGAYTCKQEVEPRTDIGNAIKLTQNEVTVPANGNMLVDFTLTLPQKIDVGEHDGCIVIQKKNDEGQATGSIRVHTRTAVRVVVLVPGSIHREVTVSNLKAASSYKKGTSTQTGLQVSLDLNNKGNVSADVAVNVHLRDVFGNEVHAPGASSAKTFFNGQYPVIADSTFTANYDAEFQPFFGGWYKVSADIAYNKQAGTFGVDTSGDILRSESEEVTIFYWPSIWFLLILGLLALAAISFAAWKILQKRQTPKRERHAPKHAADKMLWGPYEVKEGDTLKRLAEKAGVEPGKIAVLNKLRAPYRLEPGQTIYMPRKRQ